MRSLKNVALAWVMGMALGASWLDAQEPPPPEDRPARSGGADREEIQGLMDAYIISKLQEALRLGEEQYARVVVAQKKLQEHRRSYQRQKRQTLRELHALLQSAEASDEEISRLLERLDKLDADFEAQRKGDYKAIDAILSVKQRARYRVFEVEIERRLQELVREIRGKRGQPERRPRPQ